MKTLILALTLSILNLSSAQAEEKKENEVKVTRHRESFGARYILSTPGSWALQGEGGEYIKDSPFYFSGEFLVGSPVTTLTTPFFTGLFKIGIEQVKNKFLYGVDLGLGFTYASAFSSALGFTQQIKAVGGYVLGEGYRIHLDLGYLNTSTLSNFSGLFVGLGITRKIEISIKGLDD